MPSHNDGRTFTNSSELHEACGSSDMLIQAAAYKVLWNYLYPLALQMVYDQPEAEMLAQDCAQLALMRVHERLEDCREPAAFKVWVRRIVSHIVIDELRRQKRLVPLVLNESETKSGSTFRPPLLDSQPSIETTVLEKANQTELREIIRRAPISDRSRRVVLGRYLDGTSDELLAQAESKLTARTVLPSHIQVTRAKNLAKLRDWKLLKVFLEVAD